MAPKKQPIATTDIPEVLIKRIATAAVLPEKKTSGSVGFDLHVIESQKLRPHNACDVAYRLRTGLQMAIPEGYHAKIFLRSSTGDKTKLRLANGTGIIDSDYRGEIMLLVENVGSMIHYLQAGDRIAQMIIEKNTEFTLKEVDDLPTTERGEGGIGSTNN